jgi:hypothetical protein
MVEAAGFAPPSLVELRHGDLAFVAVLARRP